MNFLGMLRPLEILDDMFPFLFAYAYYDMLVCGDNDSSCLWYVGAITFLVEPLCSVCKKINFPWLEFCFHESIKEILETSYELFMICLSTELQSQRK